MSMSPIRSAGRFAFHVAAGGGALLAAGAGDNTEITGSSINRGDFEGGYFMVMARATLAANKKLSIIATVEHADDSAGSPGAFGDIPTGIATPEKAGAVTMVPTLTDSGAGSTLRGVGIIRFRDLSQLKEWIRLKVTPDLDAGAVDTAEVFLMFVGAPIVAPGSLINTTGV